MERAQVVCGVVGGFETELGGEEGRLKLSL